MKSVAELEQDYKNIKSKKLPRTEKVVLAKNVLRLIGEIEQKAASDFSFPLEEIRKAKSLMQLIGEYIR